MRNSDEWLCLSSRDKTLSAKGLQHYQGVKCRWRAMHVTKGEERREKRKGIKRVKRDRRKKGR